MAASLGIASRYKRKSIAARTSLASGKTSQLWHINAAAVIALANKRMDQSWRGRLLATGWHDLPCLGKFSTSSRATLVMRGR